jgi:hypothetical protein
VYETPNEMVYQFRQLYWERAKKIEDRLISDNAAPERVPQTLVEEAEAWIYQCTSKLLEAAATEGGILFDFGASNGPSRVQSKHYFFNGDWSYKTCPTSFQISKIMAFTGN